MVEAVKVIVAGMGTAGAFVWSLFTQFLAVITQNALIFVPVLMAILFGAIGIAVKVLRRFGVKGVR